MVDDKLALEEAQRAANYEAIKSNVKSDVGGDILLKRRALHPRKRQRIENVADGMRRTRSMRSSRRREKSAGRDSSRRISQIVDYVFFLIYGLLTVRLLLELFAARESAGFFQFIKTLPIPFYSPFRGLVPSPSTAEGSRSHFRSL